MKYNGTIYRPPREAYTFLIPITEGCTHNGCRFCNMFKEIPFRMITLEDVEEYLRESTASLGSYAKSMKRVYLVGANPFALSANRLLERISLVRKYLPNVEVVSMYARVDNIAHKSDEDLRRLKEAGVNDLYVGVESGLDDVLEYLNKGFSTEMTREQCPRLNAAGIRHIDLVMLGTGGKGRGLEAAKAIAALENEIKPARLHVNTLTAFAGTPLNDDILAGRFEPAGEREIYQEERALIEAIELPDTYYWAGHRLDSLIVEGMIGEEKEKMLACLDAAIANVDESAFHRVSRNGTM